MNDKTEQPVTDEPCGTAAGGHAVIINVPGCPLMVRAVDYNTLRAQLAEPIDMVLHCPACGMQHIDAVEELPMPMPGSSFEGSAGWTNPPHRSHLCHGCGHIWRPADVPTNGVEAVKTCGKADSKLAAPTDTLHAQLAEAQKNAERLDWLGNQFVTVRVPLRYGSKECFMGSPTDNDGEFLPWNIRAAIDAAKEEKNGA